MHQQYSRQQVEKRGLSNELIARVNDVASLTAAQIDDVAQNVGKVWGDECGIKTNQIRNIFGYISSARNVYEGVKRGAKNKSLDDVKTMLIFLKPKLAYSAGRQKSIKESNLDKFYRAAINGIEKTTQDKLDTALNNFLKLSEAIVAYHKYYESER